MKKKPLKFVRSIENKEKSFFKNIKKLGYKYFKINKRDLNDKKIIKSFSNIIHRKM